MTANGNIHSFGAASPSSGASVASPPEDVVSELCSVDEGGTPSFPRIRSVEAFYSTWQKLCDDDVEAARVRAMIMGLRDGNPPFKASDLKNQGQSWRYNFNDRMAESILDVQDASMFNLIFDVDKSIEVSATPGLFSDPHVEFDYTEGIARAYTTRFANTPKCVEAFAQAIRDCNQSGVGFLMHDELDEWVPKPVRRERIWFNPSVSADVDCTFDVVFVGSTFSLPELYDVIERADASAKRGWSIENLKKALVDFFRRRTGGNSFDERGGSAGAWEEVQRRIRENDASYNLSEMEPFSVLHGFIMERNGKVSHYIVPFVRSSGCKGFLYSNEGEYPSASACLHPIPFDYGGGDLRGVKGFGHRIFTACTVACRKLNHALDSSDLGSSLLLKDLGAGDGAMFSLLRAGPFTILPRELEPIQQSFSPPIEPALAIRQVMTSLLNNNTGVFRPQQENPMSRQTEKTAEQIRHEAAMEAQQKEDRRFLLYLRWDAVHAEIFRRMVKHDKLFIEYCESYGIPGEWLKENVDKLIVRTTRTIGSGSPTVKLNSLMQLQALARYDMDEAGRRMLAREIGAALVGYANVGKFIKSVDGNKAPTDVRSFAVLENNDMMEGQQVLVGADQLHIVHASVVIGMLVEFAQRYMQSPLDVEMEKMMNAFTLGVPHALTHLQYAMQDPYKKQQAEQMAEHLQKEIVPVLQQAYGEFEKVMQAKEQERAQIIEENMRLKQQYSKESMEAQRKMMLAQAQVEAEQVKTQSLVEERSKKTNAQMQVMIDRHAANMAMQNQKFQADMQEKFVKLQADLQRAQAEIQVMMQKAQAAASKGSVE